MNEFCGLYALLQVPDLARHLCVQFLPLRTTITLSRVCRRAHLVLGMSALNAPSRHAATQSYAAQWRWLDTHAAHFAEQHKFIVCSNVATANSTAVTFFLTLYERRHAMETRKTLLYDVCARRFWRALEALLFALDGSTRHCTPLDVLHTVRATLLYHRTDALEVLECNLPALRLTQPVEPTLCALSPDAYADYESEMRCDSGAALCGWQYVSHLTRHTVVVITRREQRWILERVTAQCAPHNTIKHTAAQPRMPCVDCRLQQVFVLGMTASDADALALDDALWALGALQRWRRDTGAVLRVGEHLCALASCVWRNARYHTKDCEPRAHDTTPWARRVFVAAGPGNASTTFCARAQCIDAQFPLCQAVRDIQKR